MLVCVGNREGTELVAPEGIAEEKKRLDIPFSGLCDTLTPKQHCDTFFIHMISQRYRFILIF